MAADNKSLGRFVLDGIPPAPRGVPQIEVTFDIDANGILNVKAVDKATGKEQSIKITGSTGLTKEEVERMTKEAEAHAAEDAEKKEAVEARNQADSLIFTAEKSLKDAGDKVAEDVKKEVEEKVAALKGILDSGSKEDLEIKTKELSEVLQKIGQNMYKNQQAAGEQPAGDQASEANGEAKPEETKTDEPVEGEVVN
jgi:molecular chaperone DnaK